MSLKFSLRELSGMYSTVRSRQHGLNKRWYKQPLKYIGGLDGLDDGYDFKFIAVDVAEDLEDLVEISFMADEKGEPIECVDWFTIYEFNKHFEIE